MRKTSLAEEVTSWEQFVAAAETNAADLPASEELRQELKALATEVRALHQERQALRARLQMLTVQLKEKMARGQDLHSRVRAGAKSVYGSDSAKLHEFGMKPDGRRRRRQP
jgi:regulator of replication initiation timing